MLEGCSSAVELEPLREYHRLLLDDRSLALADIFA